MRQSALWLLLSMLMVACIGPLAQTEDRPLTKEDELFKSKFRGLRGGELFVDAFGDKQCVAMVREDGSRFYTRGTVSARNNSKHSYADRFGVPKMLRITWREGDCRRKDESSYEGGTVVGDYTVPVASRIPNEVLDAVRRGEGGFRLKIRIHDDGPLIGWDISTGFETHMAGGDFREMRVVYEGDPKNPTRRWVKGWYIHPKTGQKIETDF
jgi:hypothetical protein